MNTKVSVVVPTYNRAPSLAVCLDALMEQDYPDYEVLLCDDGSTDHTRAVAQQYPRVQYLHGANAGPAAARNRGIRHSRGEIIAFTDDDCRVPRDWLARIMDGYARHNEVAGVGGFADPPDDVVRQSVFARHERFVASRSYREGGRELVGGPTANVGGGAGNISYRKIILDRLGGFDEWFPYAAAEDHDLRMRVHALGYDLLFIPMCVEHLRAYSWDSFRRQQIARGRGVVRWEAKINGRITPRRRILLRVIKRTLLYPTNLVWFANFSLGTVHTIGELLDAYGQWLEWKKLAAS